MTLRDVARQAAVDATNEWNQRGDLSIAELPFVADAVALAVLREVLKLGGAYSSAAGMTLGVERMIQSLSPVETPQTTEPPSQIDYCKCGHIKFLHNGPCKVALCDCLGFVSAPLAPAVEPEPDPITLDEAMIGGVLLALGRAGATPDPDLIRRFNEAKAAVSDSGGLTWCERCESWRHNTDCGREDCLKVTPQTSYFQPYERVEAQRPVEPSAVEPPSGEATPLLNHPAINTARKKVNTIVRDLQASGYNGPKTLKDYVESLDVLLAIVETLARVEAAPAVTPCSCPKRFGNAARCAAAQLISDITCRCACHRPPALPLAPTPPETEPRPNLGEVLAAANNADWQQVLLNGGPPCFHFDAERGKFCLAAQRWAGHGKLHPFTGLADMIGSVVYNANSSVILASSPSPGAVETPPFVPQPPYCTKRANGWCCTRPLGHSGEHVATDTTGREVYMRWHSAALRSGGSR